MGGIYHTYLPVKGAGEHEIIVDAQLIQSLVEISLVDEPAGAVDDDERKHHPTDDGDVSW